MSTSANPLRLAIVGAGYATAQLHLPALQSLAGLKVVGLADLDPVRLQRVADQFRIEERTTDMAALLNNSAVEAVAVCVPPQLHVPVALAALAENKHLFIEKPLALTLEEIDLLIARSRDTDRKVLMGFNLRHHRHSRQARQLIEQEALGSIEFVRSVSSSRVRYQNNFPDWRRRREQGGGVLIDLAVHHFDLWRFLLHTEIEEVFAASRSADADDLTATVTARLANGVLATVVCSQCAVEGNEVEIVGGDGRLHLSFYRFDGFEFTPRSSFSCDVRSRLRSLAHTAHELPRGIAAAKSGGEFLNAYRAEWRHFIDCVRRDTPPECTLEDGRRSMQAVLAAFQSTKENHPIQLASS